MPYIEADKNTEQGIVIQVYCLQHAQANKSCDYSDGFYIAGFLSLVYIKPVPCYTEYQYCLFLSHYLNKNKKAKYFHFNCF